MFTGWFSGTGALYTVRYIYRTVLYVALVMI